VVSCADKTFGKGLIP